MFGRCKHEWPEWEDWVETFSNWNRVPIRMEYTKVRVCEKCAKRERVFQYDVAL